MIKGSLHIVFLEILPATLFCWFYNNVNYFQWNEILSSHLNVADIEPLAIEPLAIEPLANIANIHSKQQSLKAYDSITTSYITAY